MAACRKKKSALLAWKIFIFHRKAILGITHTHRSTNKSRWMLTECWVELRTGFCSCKSGLRRRRESDRYEIMNEEYPRWKHMKYLMEFGQEIDYLQGLSTDLPRFPLERYKLDRYRSGEEHFSNLSGHGRQVMFRFSRTFPSGFVLVETPSLCLFNWLSFLLIIE